MRPNGLGGWTRAPYPGGLEPFPGFHRELEYIRRRAPCRLGNPLNVIEFRLGTAASARQGYDLQIHLVTEDGHSQILAS